MTAEWYSTDYPTAKRDADVLWLRRRGWTQKDIGARLGLSQGRISQIEVRALRWERVNLSRFARWLAAVQLPDIMVGPDGWLGGFIVVDGP